MRGTQSNRRKSKEGAVLVKEDGPEIVENNSGVGENQEHIFFVGLDLFRKLIEYGQQQVDSEKDCQPGQRHGHLGGRTGGGPDNRSVEFFEPAGVQRKRSGEAEPVHRPPFSIVCAEHGADAQDGDIAEQRHGQILAG